MRKIIDLEDDTFQAHCQLDCLRNHIEDGATIRHVRDDVVTLDLRDGTEFAAVAHRVREALRAGHSYD